MPHREPVTRRDWLAGAAAQLRGAGIDSARLDAELLLTHALNISRTALHAHDDEPVTDSMLTVLEAMLSLRVIRVPLAYIVGHREFYGRLFKVTPNVLIPRTETEDIVTVIDELVGKNHDTGTPTIVDVGTGSGALAVTLALEHPGARVYGIDISARALAVAGNNAATYGASVTLVKNDLLDGLFIGSLDSPAFIVANLPYVNDTDARSPETDHEPAEALFAADAGMAFIDRLIPQAAAVLRAGDHLLLESNPGQQPAITSAAQENGFRVTETRNLISVLQKG